MDYSRLNTNKGVCLSVIVPVYNVGSYLGRCIDSLTAAEGIEKTEIIIVDDGSTDDSGSIAGSFADRYDFISCYHKENGGLSDARNYGLKKASGSYVFFCDPDDMVIPDAFDALIRTVSKSSAEVIMFDGLTVGEDDSVTDSGYDVLLGHSGLDKAAEMSGLRAMISQINDHGRFAVTAWLMACRRDYLLNNGLLFEPGLIHEDELWTPQVLAGASKVSYLPEKIYCYRLRENSIMSGASELQEKHAKAMVHVMNSLYDFYSGQISDADDRNSLLSHWSGKYLWILLSYEVYRYDCRKDVPRRRIWACSSGMKAKIKGMILSLFGVKAFCRLFGSGQTV